jgi:hypothetical protein
MNKSEIKTVICPICKTENTDNWPVAVGDNIEEDGCQDCWEKECNQSWWEEVKKLCTVIGCSGVSEKCPGNTDCKIIRKVIK